VQLYIPLASATAPQQSCASMTTDGASCQLLIMASLLTKRSKTLSLRSEGCVRKAAVV
jgi:hypothetical protein